MGVKAAVCWIPALTGACALQVVDAPEVLTIISSIPHVELLLNSFYSCRYAEFLQVSLAISSAKVNCSRHSVDGSMLVVQQASMPCPSAPA